MPQVSQFSIPHLCKNTAILRIVVLVELFAIVITVAQANRFWLQELGLTSLYMQWIALSSTAVLCLLRRTINRQAIGVRLVGVFAVCFTCFLLTEFASQSLVDPQPFDWASALSRSLIALIAILIAMRLFALLSTLDQQGRIEMEARVQALQSRIRPHFLFNSLNTISELTATQPDKAEEAISSLSLLFRAGLEGERRFHSLESELNLCQRYLDLERWRLDDKLQVDWQINIKNAPAYEVPKLILQPLIENAVVHGAREDGSVNIHIDVRETNKDLSLVIKNSKSPLVKKSSDGNGMAMDNIRERLFVLYDDQQTFRVREEQDSYRVLMRFPKRKPISLR